MFASVYCAIYQYKKTYDPNSQKLSSFLDWVLVSRKFFRELRLALPFSNPNLYHYQNHGFQIGAATIAAARGLSELRIQDMGRWKSNT